MAVTAGVTPGSGQVLATEVEVPGAVDRPLPPPKTTP